MKKRIAVFSLGTVLLALCVSVDAQQAPKVPRIGYLATTDPSFESIRSDAIRLALRERGYVEGQNKPESVSS